MCRCDKEFAQPQLTLARKLDIVHRKTTTRSNMIPSVRRPIFVTHEGILDLKLPLLAVVDMERERDDRPAVRATSSTLAVDGECELRSTALYESASSSSSGS